MNNNKDINEKIKKTLAVIFMLVMHIIPITLSIIGLVIRILWEFFVVLPLFTSHEWMKVVESKIVKFIDYATNEDN